MSQAKRLARLATTTTCVLTGSLLTAAMGCDRQPPAESVDPVQLELVARFDTDATPAAAPWGSIIDVELRADGSVFVVDGLSRTLSAFDSSGVPLAHFGGRGRGPGELEGPAGLTWDPDGHLWVVDLGTGRLSAFGPNGELVTTVQATGATPFTPLAIRFTTPSSLRVVALDFSGGSPEQPMAVLVDLAVAENTVEPVGLAPMPFVRWPDLFDFRTDDIALLMVVPFSPEPLFGIDPSGHLWYGDGASGRVDRWVVADSFDVASVQDASPLPVTSTDIQATLEGNPDIEELEVTGGASAVAELMERIPENHPRIEGFFFGDDESIWVMRSAAEAEGDERAIDVFDGSGQLMGIARAPLAATPRPRMRDGWLVGVMRDELGVESVALFRVQM